MYAIRSYYEWGAEFVGRRRDEIVLEPLQLALLGHLVEKHDAAAQAAAWPADDRHPCLVYPLLA